MRFEYVVTWPGGRSRRFRTLAAVERYLLGLIERHGWGHA